MEEGLFPSVKAWEEEAEEDVEEERRLCYVGMTRAREQLYLTNVVIRRVWGNTNYQEPSRFFEEIPKDLVDFRDFSKVHQRSGYSSDVGEGYGSRPVATPSTGYSQAKSNPFIGRRVSHPEYGTGTVLALEGAGADQKVVIEFKNRDQRKFLLRYVASYFD
jgi:DNA helicase-2/ATP-dependent DNA helicase PcrA